MMPFLRKFKIKKKLMYYLNIYKTCFKVKGIINIKSRKMVRGEKRGELRGIHIIRLKLG